MMATTCGLPKCGQPSSFSYYSAGRPGLTRNSSSVSSSSIGRRKTAVERLEETKGRYVKTEHVLGHRQEFRHRAPLQMVNSLPSSHYCKPIIKSSYEVTRPAPIQLPIVPLPARPKSETFQPRRQLSLPCSANNRLSPQEIPNLEQRLRLLITSSSKEDLAASTAKGTQIANENVYKSMPDLSPEKIVDGIYKASRHSYSFSSGSIDEDEEIEENETEEVEEEGDVGETGLHCSLTTSDYVSRSSSYKSRYLSELEKNFVQNHPPPFSNKPERQRPVSRSKSDVSYRFQKAPSEQLQKRNSYSSAELEHFFDTMGLDPRVWHTISTPAYYPSSPPCFFDSFSSINSDDHHSSVCSADSDSPKEGLSNRDLKLHAPVETSIVEKNARVIKWIYSCKKAQEAADNGA